MFKTLKIIKNEHSETEKKMKKTQRNVGEPIPTITRKEGQEEKNLLLSSKWIGGTIKIERNTNNENLRKKLD